jgi:hypothetical protein
MGHDIDSGPTIKKYTQMKGRSLRSSIGGDRKFLVIGSLWQWSSEAGHPSKGIPSLNPWDNKARPGSNPLQ